MYGDTRHRRMTRDSRGYKGASPFSPISILSIDLGLYSWG